MKPVKYIKLVKPIKPVKHINPVKRTKPVKTIKPVKPIKLSRCAALRQYPRELTLFHMIRFRFKNKHIVLFSVMPTGCHRTKLGICGTMDKVGVMANPTYSNVLQFEFFKQNLCKTFFPYVLITLNNQSTSYEYFSMLEWKAPSVPEQFTNKRFLYFGFFKNHILVDVLSHVLMTPRKFGHDRFIQLGGVVG